MTPGFEKRWLAFGRVSQAQGIHAQRVRRLIGEALCAFPFGYATRPQESHGMEPRFTFNCSFSRYPLRRGRGWKGSQKNLHVAEIARSILPAWMDIRTKARFSRRSDCGNGPESANRFSDSRNRCATQPPFRDGWVTRASVPAPDQLREVAAPG